MSSDIYRTEDADSDETIESKFDEDDDDKNAVDLDYFDDVDE